MVANKNVSRDFVTDASSSLEIYVKRNKSRDLVATTSTSLKIAANSKVSYCDIVANVNKSLDFIAAVVKVVI